MCINMYKYMLIAYKNRYVYYTLNTSKINNIF